MDVVFSLADRISVWSAAASSRPEPRTRSEPSRVRVAYLGEEDDESSRDADG
jgi:hypothetical protein